MPLTDAAESQCREGPVDRYQFGVIASTDTSGQEFDAALDATSRDMR
jgi:hypothetical protein